MYCLSDILVSTGGMGNELAPSWTFLTNHAHVFICLAANPEARLREIASAVGITERAVHRILTELEEAGYIEREREGRRNHYRLDRKLPLRHPLEAHRTIGALLDLLASKGKGGQGGSRNARARPPR